MHQHQHEAWNAGNYPGTLQLCSQCDEPTGRCEDDSLYADDDREIGPLCMECYRKTPAYRMAEQDIADTMPPLLSEA